MFPIPGTKRLKYLEENAAAFFVELTPEEKRFLEDTFHQDNVSTPLLLACLESGTRLAFTQGCIASLHYKSRHVAACWLKWQLDVSALNA